MVYYYVGGLLLLVWLWFANTNPAARTTEVQIYYAGVVAIVAAILIMLGDKATGAGRRK